MEKKQPVKIKEEFASNDTELGKYLRTGFGSILFSVPMAWQGRFSLPPHRFFDVSQLSVVVAELEQNIVTVRVGGYTVEVWEDSWWFSQFLKGSTKSDFKIVNRV